MNKEVQIVSRMNSLSKSLSFPRDFKLEATVTTFGVRGGSLLHWGCLLDGPSRPK